MKKKSSYHQCTGGGLRKGGYVQPDWLGPTPTMVSFGRAFLISVVALAHHHSQFRARWDSNHGAGVMTHGLLAVMCWCVWLPATIVGILCMATDDVVHAPCSSTRAWCSSTVLAPNGSTAIIVCTRE